MKKKTMLLLLTILLLAGVFILWQNKKEKTEFLFATEINKTKTLDERAEEILQKMTLEEKVGQMLFVGIEGTVLDDKVLTRLHDYHIGGVVLFDRNMQNPKQVAELVNSLQKEELKEKSRLPLFIAIDQEGGMVVRMEEGQLIAPPAESIAKTGDVSEATQWAKTTAVQLKAMGINVNFAPVVDLGSTYKRSYGTDPWQVISFAEAAIAGYQSEDILAALKHFPGLGKVKTDTHIATDTIDVPLAVLEKEDLTPYRELIKKLDNQTFFVMVSHAKYPALDTQYPASMSYSIMHGLLQEKLGFSGLIVTDDVEMGAVSKLYSFEEIGALAAKGGADLILVCKDLAHQIEVYNGIMKAINSGELSQEGLDNTVKKIIKSKLKNIKGKVLTDVDKADSIIEKIKEGKR